MASLSVPLEVLRGLYLGILTGVLPALVAFAFGFLFRYVTGVTIPAFAVIVLGLALAGVNGGLLAFVDPTITDSANSVALMTAVVVVLMLSLYTHSLGDRLATTVPRRLSLDTDRARTVSADVVDLVGGRGQVAVRVVGEVADVEGYPPLADDLRTELGSIEWKFPADLPLGELERRMRDRYHSEFDLQAVDVSIDRRGRAAVAAAPPSSGVSKRLEHGKRAVSIECLLPSGIARGEEVTVLTAEGEVDGTVVSARSSLAAEPQPPTRDHHDPESSDAGTGGPADHAARAPTTTGGRGRLTIATTPSDAESLLDATSPRVVVRSRGSRREFELVSLLRQSGRSIRDYEIRSGSRLAGSRIGDADVRGNYDVAVLAVRRDGSWRIAPDAQEPLDAGTRIFVAGSRRALAQFEEVAT